MLQDNRPLPSHSLLFCREIGLSMYQVSSLGCLSRKKGFTMRSTTHLIFKGTLVLSFLVISLFCSSLPGFPRLTAQARSLVQTFDANTGLSIWSYSANELSSVQSSPTVVNGVLYVGILTTLYALDAQKGTLIWDYPLQRYRNIYSAPAVVSGIVYF